MEKTTQDILDLTKALSDAETTKVVDAIMKQHQLALVPQMVVQLQKYEVRQEDAFDKVAVDPTTQNENTAS